MAAPKPLVLSGEHIDKARIRREKAKIDTVNSRLYVGAAPYNYSYYGYDEKTRKASLIDKGACRRIASLAGFSTVGPQGYSIIAGLMDLGVQHAVQQINSISAYAREKGYTGTKFGHPHHVEAYINNYKGEIAQGALSQIPKGVMERKKQSDHLQYESHKNTDKARDGERLKFIYSGSLGFIKWAVRSINTGFQKTSKKKVTVFNPTMRNYVGNVANAPNLEQICWPATLLEFKSSLIKLSWQINGQNWSFVNAQEGADSLITILGIANASYNSGKKTSKKTSPLLFSFKPIDLFVMVKYSNRQANQVDPFVGWVIQLVGKDLWSYFEGDEVDSKWHIEKRKYLKLLYQQMPNNEIGGDLDQDGGNNASIVYNRIRVCAADAKQAGKLPSRRPP